MAKYGRDNLGREIWREDDNGNRTYNTSYIKKHLGSGSNSSSNVAGVNYPLQMILAVLLFIVSALFFVLFIYWGIQINGAVAGIVFMEIFPTCGLIASVAWIYGLMH